jgi:hypothetical protein
VPSLLSPPPADLELSVLAALRRVSRRELARRSGIGYWRLSRIFNGHLTPQPDELVLLRAAMFDEARP